MRLWICVAFLVAAFGASEAQDDDYSLPGFWDDDYEWYDEGADKLGDVSANKEPVEENKEQPAAAEASVASDQQQDADANSSEELLQELEALRNSAVNELKNEAEPNGDDDSFDNFDYQVEDNRSEPKDQDLGDPLENDNEDEQDNDDATEEDIKVDIPEISANDENQEIFDETRNILNDENKEGNDFADKVDEVENEDNDDFWETFFDVDDTVENVKGSPDKADEIKDNAEEPVDTVVSNEDVSKDELDKLLEKIENIQDEESSKLFDSDSDEVRDMQKEIDQMLDSLNDFQNENHDKQPIKIEEPQKDNVDSTNVKQENIESIVWDDSSVETADESQQADGNEKLTNAVEGKDEKDDANNQDNEEEDTFDKVYADLDDDLKKLFETWDKLSNVDEDQNDDVSRDGDDVLEYEAKYGKPFREDVVLSQREDYENIDDSNLDDIFSDIFDDNNEDLVENDATDKLLLDANDVPKEKEEPIFYNNDGLFDESESNHHENAEDDNDSKSDDHFASNEDKIQNEKPDEAQNPKPVDNKMETSSDKINVQDLNARQYDDLMKQFSIVHSDDLDIESEDFGKNVVPVHIHLSVDEATTITSPGFPNNYPATNNIIDWILDGEGQGIELNITTFNVSGTLGDYLLVIPGGIDTDNKDGLIFSHYLNTARRYRFTDVNRMFLRFETNQAMMGQRQGFELTVKMIAPIPDPEPEPEPEGLPFPEARLTVNLGVASLREFLDVKEEFRQLVADMATMYIHNNDIDIGLNSTSEVTQITNVTICNINWPNTTMCVAVRFGVPLQHEDDSPPRLNEDDLRAMWYTYVYRDPFAIRLRRLGINEFDVPDDSQVMMLWLVVAGAVLISAAMLAVALWRFSCFDNYTRMPTFSDTDSVANEKRGFDLYPTPHQPLPPMYAEPDYKWDDDGKFEDSTRVDMGGFANRSFAPDELLDLDSDEEGVTDPRDRNNLSPRDIYPV